MPWRQPRIRVSGMLWSDDKLMLVRQGRPSSPRWMLPGGGVESGEAMTVALEREMAEEIGIDHMRVGDPVAIVESIAPPSTTSGRHLVHVIFSCQCAPDLLENLRPSPDPDVHEIRLVSRDELLTLPLHPPIAGFLRSWHPGDRLSYLGPMWAP